MSVQKTLADLVNINSVSQHSNAAIINYLEQRCINLGMQTRRLPYVDEIGIEKINLIAIAGGDFAETPAVQLALVGHTDTVPFDPAWTEATTLTEDDGKLFGRGACDTKAFIASMLAVAEALDLNSLTRQLAFVFTADEELGLFGAKHLAAAKALHANYAIVGEPTSLQPMRAGKGYCLGEIIVRGKEAHSAYPDYGVSAISKAAHLLVRIEAIAEDLKQYRHADFDPPFTTLNVGLIHGGTAKNVIPGECRLTIEWRPIPGQNPDLLLELLQQAIANERNSDPDFDCEVMAGRTDGGFETASDSDLVKLLEEFTGLTSGTVAFGTEAPQLIDLGAKAVVLGPGDIRVAHRTGEYVRIEELNRCVDVLSRAVHHYCFC